MAGGYHIGLWCLLITAAICDLIWGKIFNWVNGLFLVAGLFTHFYLGGMSALGPALLAVTVAFIFFFPLYLLKALAAGDVKLLMAVGAWSNPRVVFDLAIFAVLVGAAVGLFVLLKKRGFHASVKSLKSHLKKPNAELVAVRIPFAPAFLCALFLMQIWEKYH